MGSKPDFIHSLIRGGRLSAYALVNALVEIMQEEKTDICTILISPDEGETLELQYTLDDWQTIRAAIATQPTHKKDGG